MIKIISTKLIFTYTLVATIMLLQGCKEMSSLTSDGVKKAAKDATDSTTTPTPTTNTGSTDTNSNHLQLVITGPDSIQAGQCRSYVVSLKNGSGLSKNATELFALTLSGQGSGSIHAGSNCSGAALSTLNLGKGTSFTSFSYRNSTAENVNLVIDSPADSEIQSAFYSVQIIALSTTTPTQLVLTGPTSVTEGACSGPVVVKTVDASFNSTAVTSNLPFTVLGGASFSIFTNASCLTTLASPVISAQSSSTSFYFISNSPGNIVISADDGASLTDGAMSVQVAATSGTSAVKFALNGPASVLAGACSAGYTIKTTNGSGLDAPVSSTTVVNITGKGSGDFYDDASCSTPISSVTFASGDSTKSFYYKGASVANLTFNVDDVGPLTPASTSVAIIADVPTHLALTGPASIVLGECRAYTVTTKDTNNFTSAVSGTTSINLTGAGAGAFYTDSSCINSTSSVVVNSGQSNALFYYKSPSAAASLTLSADNSGVLTAGTIAIAVAQLPYSKVVFSRPTLNAGVCTAVTVTLKDSLNNTALAASGGVGVTLSSTGGAAFYSANTCAGGTLITSSTIANGASSAIVYVKDNIAGSITLGVTSTGLSADSWSATVNPGANNTLKLTGPATNSVGSCTAYDLKLEDSLGNLSPASSSVSVNFSGLSNARFYSDSGCSTLANSVTLATSSSQTQIYLKGNTAEALTIAASSGSLVAASASVSLIAGTSNKLILSGASTASAGACTALTVAVQDSFNNPITQGSNLVVTMFGNSSGSFYSENTCTTLASTVTVPSAASSAIIYFKSNAPASLAFTAQASGLFDGAKNLTVNPLAPSKLVMTGPTTITAGICSAYSISLQDTLNNLSAAGASKTLNFSGALSGAFYSDSSCALPTSSISLTSSQTTAAIYYKASAAQTPNLVVDDSGLPDLTASTLPVTVNAGSGGTTIALKISGATSANTNTCIPYAVMTTDAAGLSYNVTSNLTVTMGGAGTGGFYSNSSCSTASSTVTVASGSSLSYVYYMSSTAQNLVFSATASGASATTLPVAITSGAGPSTVTRLTLTGSSSILTNACIPYIVSTADSSGNSMNAASNTAITLSGKGSGDFFTDDACTISAAGATSISSGSSFTTIYYKNAAPQNLILISQSTGLSNGTLSLSVTATAGGSNAGPAVKLAFVSQPSSMASTNENLAEQPIVAVQDSNNNVASTSSATVTLAAFTDNACTMSAGSIVQATTNPANAVGGVVNFAGVNLTSSQTIYIKASSPGLAPACSNAIQVYPSVAAKLTFSIQPSTTAIAGALLATQPRVSVLNYTNQVVTNSVNAVSVAAFTDSSCSTPVTGTFTLTQNNILPTSGNVTFAGISYNLISTIYLKATASGISSACSSGITITPAAPHHLGIHYQPAITGRAGDTFSITARLYDIYGNATLSNHNLALTAYKTGTCTGATTSITGNSATASLGTATFSSVVFTEASTMSLKVTDTTDPSVTEVCSNSISVDGGSPTKLVFTTQPSSLTQVYVSLQTNPIVTIQDSYSNRVNSATNNVTISAYTDSGCSTTPATGTLSGASLTMAPTSGIASFSSINYSKAEVIYLKATSSGLASACSSAITLSSLPSRMAMRDDTTCAITNGTVKCWGLNSGNLGEGSPSANAPYPADVASTTGLGALSNITDISLGSGFGCALSSSGNVFCWGLGTSGQLGDGTLVTKYIPVQVKDTAGSGVLSNIVSLSSGLNHTCAATSAGAVYCWGSGGNGALGQANTTTYNLPQQVKGVGGTGTLTGITSVGSGDYHTCALAGTSDVYCWGTNNNSQLGDNTTTTRTSPVKVLGVGAVGTLSGMVSITAGPYHTCAVSSVGAGYCWGRNTYGQLGDNSTTTRATPVQILGTNGVGYLSNIISMSAGGGATSTAHTCAVTSSRNVYCWGTNASGQVGDNTTVQKNAPVQVVGADAVGTLTNAISVVAGTNSTCGLIDDGYMYCWGVNNNWNLGDQSTTQRNSPVKVRDNSSLFSKVSASGYGGCGISNEKVYCWGYNGHGQIGDGTTTNRQLPTLIPTLSGVKEIAAGNRTNCAILNSGEAYCWGDNSYGQLGDGTTTASYVPVQVKGVGGAGTLSNLISISVSSSDGTPHVCAVNSSGSTFCWGYNNVGQLGSNNNTTSYTPVQVVGLGGSGVLSNIKEVSAGGYGTNGHTCAYSNDGIGYCWGYNGYHGLGNATGSNSYFPIIPTGLTTGVTAISARGFESCAIKSGAGLCWGYNYYTGGGSYQVVGSSPTQIWASGVTAISAGVDYACGIVNKSFQCYNTYGTYTYHTATNTAILRDIQSISIGHRDTGTYQKNCALKANGVLYCWGADSYTTSAYGTTSNSSNPTVVAVPPMSSNQITSIAAGENHSCGIINGVTQCWGTSTVGALGGGITSTTTPKPVLLNSNSSLLIGQASVIAGATHSCSISNSAEAFCWGDNSYGKLGNNSTVNSQKAIKVLGEGGIGTLASVNSLGVGYRHNCATVSGGSVYCWGYNAQGQLGIDSTMTMGAATKVVGVGGTGYLTGSKVVSGRAHSCAISSGNVYCWGSNDHGQLGANTAAAQSNTPLKVVSVSGVGSLSNVSNLVAGAYHTCALASGITYCWGANSNQQLGNGSTQDSSYPVGVMNSDLITLTGVTTIYAGAKHSCALTSLNEAYCWGMGTYGQLGLNSSTDTGAATRVAGAGNIGNLSAYLLSTGSSSNNTCSITTDQTNVYCWGSGSSGQLGNGTIPFAQLIPTPFTFSSTQYLLVR